MGAIGVAPLLLRPGQGRFENMLVPNPGPHSVLSQLIGVDGVDEDTAEPCGLWTALGHWLFCQLS